MKTFDRYLLSKFLHVYVILFVTLFGLFVVIDGFTNVDNFQKDGDSATTILSKMLTYYAYQSSLFFDMIGSILAAIAVLIVFALLQRHSEIHPILAAGIPTFRLYVPVLFGTLLINLGLIANQELIIPRIAPMLQASRSGLEKGTGQVDPLYDNSSHIYLNGRRLSLANRTIIEPSFVLPPAIAQGDITTIKSPEGEYFKADGDRPAGWRLKNTSPQFDAIRLTPEGRKYVRPIQGSPNDIFVVTDLGFDQLYNRDQGYAFASTPDMLRRLKNPAFGSVSIRGQTLHFHFRMARPLINLAVVLVAVPLVLRKESRGLIANMAICTGVLTVCLGITKFSMYLGQVNLVTPEMAAWVPLFFCGSLGAWLTGVTQT